MSGTDSRCGSSPSSASGWRGRSQQRTCESSSELYWSLSRWAALVHPPEWGRGSGVRAALGPITWRLAGLPGVCPSSQWSCVTVRLLYPCLPHLSSSLLLVSLQSPFFFFAFAKQSETLILVLFYRWILTLKVENLKVEAANLTQINLTVYRCRDRTFWILEESPFICGVVRSRGNEHKEHLFLFLFFDQEDGGGGVGGVKRQI